MGNRFEASFRSRAKIFASLLKYRIAGYKPSTEMSRIQEPPPGEPLVKNSGSILDLPTELLDIILSYLSTYSQAYLALSCKRFYLKHRDVCRRPELLFPYYVSNPSATLEKQREFLINLESSTWKYCAACFKLHPPQEFHNLGSALYHRYCKWPGEFAICPCQGLTSECWIEAYLRLPQTRAFAA
jgi:hypothetical protein